MRLEKILKDVPFEELKEWCHNNLTKEQRKEIGNAKNYKKYTKSPNGRSNIHLSKKVYVYELNGDLVGEYSSIRKSAKELGLNYGSIRRAFKDKRPAYKMYYITESSTFDF